MSPLLLASDMAGRESVLIVVLLLRELPEDEMAIPGVPSERTDEVLSEDVLVTACLLSEVTDKVLSEASLETEDKEPTGVETISEHVTETVLTDSVLEGDFLVSATEDNAGLLSFEAGSGLFKVEVVILVDDDSRDLVMTSLHRPIKTDCVALKLVLTELSEDSLLVGPFVIDTLLVQEGDLSSLPELALSFSLSLFSSGLAESEVLRDPLGLSSPNLETFLSLTVANSALAPAPIKGLISGLFLRNREEDLEEDELMKLPTLGKTGAVPPNLDTRELVLEPRGLKEPEALLLSRDDEASDELEAESVASLL